MGEKSCPKCPQKLSETSTKVVRTVHKVAFQNDINWFSKCHFNNLFTQKKLFEAKTKKKMYIRCQLFCTSNQQKLCEMSTNNCPKCLFVVRNVHFCPKCPLSEMSIVRNVPVPFKWLSFTNMMATYKATIVKINAFSIALYKFKDYVEPCWVCNNLATWLTARVK